MTTLMLFHRDLRIVDHNALECIRDKHIIPLFIFTPQQVSTNPLKSTNSIQFMIESLRDLEKAIRAKHGTLYIAYGNTVEVLSSIFRSHPFTILAVLILCSEGYKLVLYSGAGGEMKCGGGGVREEG